MAFATILGLVPLLAAFGFIGTRLVDRYQDRLLEILMNALPYSEVAIADRLELYMHQAESLQGFGLLAFLFIGVGTLHTIEETINKIWRVGERATLRGKVVSLALILFWVPLLVGGVLSLSVMARRHATFGVLLEESLLVGALPFVVTSIGLTMLYWQIPRAPVHFRWALVGGVMVALSLEVLRRPFAYYVANINQLSLVYGSFAITLLFMISIQIAWWLVLVGTEVAYVGQHLEALERGRRVDASVRGPWVGLAAMLVLARGLRQGTPLREPGSLAAELALPPGVVEDSLLPLLDRGLVVQTETDGLILARDPNHLTVEEILRSHDGPVDRLMAESGTEVWGRLLDLRGSLRDLRAPKLQGLLLADLLETEGAESTAPDGAPTGQSDAGNRSDQVSR